LGYESLPFFLPPLAALGVAATLATVSSMTFALLLTGGLAAGYAAYGLSHSIIHNARFRYVLPRRWAAAHHIHHCHPDQNFGVTTPLWDVVLKTRYISNRRRKSDREIDVM
jgi:sterol desaturase/sphingolipid hydroxylase (fatty acid hydroxylase superfamily)